MDEHNYLIYVSIVLAVIIIIFSIFSSCKKNVKFDVSADSNCVSVIVCPEGVKK